MSLHQGAVIDAPIEHEQPMKARDMWHRLHHFEGEVAVAFCGFRKVPEELGFKTTECVVCAELAGEGS